MLAAACTHSCAANVCAATQRDGRPAGLERPPAGQLDASGPAPFDAAVSHALEYIEEHAHKARGLNKPLILEEFGLARDGQSADAAHSAVVHRDAFYAAVVRAAGAS